MKTTPLLVAATFFMLPVCASLAQQPPPPPGEGRGFGRPSPVVAALDTNGDGVVDEKEIANASASLKTLDKNGDGKLTQDELRPMRPERGGGNAEEMTNNLLKMDKNGDGKLSKDELPERMQPMVDSGDSDKDGALSKDEVKAMVQKRQGPAPQGRKDHD